MVSSMLAPSMGRDGSTRDRRDPTSTRPPPAGTVTRDRRQVVAERVADQRHQDRHRHQALAVVGGDHRRGGGAADVGRRGDRRAVHVDLEQPGAGEAEQAVDDDPDRRSRAGTPAPAPAPRARPARPCRRRTRRRSAIARLCEEGIRRAGVNDRAMPIVGDSRRTFQVEEMTITDRGARGESHPASQVPGAPSDPQVEVVAHLRAHRLDRLGGAACSIFRRPVLGNPRPAVEALGEALRPRSSGSHTT
jgi:hypothetical protein